MLEFFKKRSPPKQAAKEVALDPQPVADTQESDKKTDETYVGPYLLLRELGKGGMAEVYVARRVTEDGSTKTVAVKVLDPKLALDASYQKMFREEAKLSMKLSHSNIAQVFDVGRDGQKNYLVMEWVDGSNLAKICQLLYSHKLTVPLDVTVYVIGEVLRALIYAHQITDCGTPMGIVHRDVSPQNVLISVSGEVKLTDFGIARVSTNETSGRMIKGKLRYMSPEQISGNSKAPTVDLYAVGAMLHELLDADKFRGEIDDRALYGQIVGGTIPPLKFPDQVPKEIQQLRLALLAADPRKRIQSARAAFEMLQEWPGYRNASLDLAELCCICTGVSGARSSVGWSLHDASPDLASMTPEQQKAWRIYEGLEAYKKKLEEKKWKESRRAAKQAPQAVEQSEHFEQPPPELSAEVQNSFRREVSVGEIVFTPSQASSLSPVPLPSSAYPAPQPVKAKIHPLLVPTRTMTVPAHRAKQEAAVKQEPAPHQEEAQPEPPPQAQPQAEIHVQPVQPQLEVQPQPEIQPQPEPPPAVPEKLEKPEKLKKPKKNKGIELEMEPSPWYHPLVLAPWVICISCLGWIIYDEIVLYRRFVEYTNSLVAKKPLKPALDALLEQFRPQQVTPVKKTQPCTPSGSPSNAKSDKHTADPKTEPCTPIVPSESTNQPSK